MSRKSLFMTIFIGVFCLGCAILTWALTPSSAAAQCGSNPPSDSSCYTCHVQDDPVANTGLWHGIHANKDCCARCHGGNCSATDKTLAHQGMVANPLNDIYTSCHSCHPDNYQELAETYAITLNIVPGSIPTPTPAPTEKVISSSLVILPSPGPTTAPAIPLQILLAGLVAIVLIIFGIIWLVMHLI